MILFSNPIACGRNTDLNLDQKKEQMNLFLMCGWPIVLTKLEAL